jgi:hypothetical protein
VINNCIHFLRVTQNAKYIPIKLANFTAWYSVFETIDDGITSEVFYRIQGKLFSGQNLPQVTVLHKSLESFDWIKVWPEAITEPGTTIKGRLRHCIQIISSRNFEQKTTYQFTGWHSLAGKWIYLYEGGAVGAENINRLLSKPDPINF